MLAASALFGVKVVILDVEECKRAYFKHTYDPYPQGAVASRLYLKI
jgi:hypothetical protein